MRYTVKQFVENYTKTDNLIVLTQHPNWIERLFGKKECDRKFTGNCTVWYEIIRDGVAPELDRVGLDMEYFLCKKEKELKFNNEKINKK
jgi:hypothetical protein